MRLRPATIRTLTFTLLVSGFAIVSIDGQEDRQKEVKELAQFRLGMPLIQKFEQATKNLVKLAEKETGIFGKVREKSEPGKVIDAMVKNMDAEPQVAAAVVSAGLSTRDYALTMLALMQATMLVEFKKHAEDQEMPIDVPAENIKFVEANEQKINTIIENLRKLSPPQAGTQ